MTIERTGGLFTFDLTVWVAWTRSLIYDLTEEFGELAPGSP